MNINLNNYEAYFLDYHEGSLSPALEKELMDFIALHPELKEEFESFEPITLKDAEGIKFDEKETLKKHRAGINASNFEEYAIEHIEGTLPVASQNELKTFIGQNPAYKKELELYSKTKLVPDTSIIFDDKASLKRKNKRPYTLYYWSAAASVAIIIATYFLLNRNETPSGNIIANHIQPNTSGVQHKISSTDSGTITHKNPATIPLIIPLNNNPVAIKTPGNNRTKNVDVLHDTTNSYVAGINQARYSYAPQSLTTGGFRLIPENPALVSIGDFKYMTIFNNWQMKYSAPEPENESIELHPESKKNKILYVLAKLTCKGLHKITGQHIVMEKKFDSDTTNVIAYQLDLGNKKIEFPVKD